MATPIFFGDFGPKSWFIWLISAYLHLKWGVSE